MNRKEKLERELKANKREISTLQTFRLTKPVKQLLRQLFGEQSHIRSQLRRLLQTQTENEKTRQERVENANKNRSQKMKRTFRYLNAILKNYPIDMTLKELRSAFSRHKKGLDTDISDIIWRNPSP